METTLEERVSKLEAKMTKLLDEKNVDSGAVPWWKQWFGAFADSPEYAQADAAGRAYRESLRPENEEET